MSWVAKRVPGVIDAQAQFAQRRLRVLTPEAECTAAKAETLISKLGEAGYDATLDKITPGPGVKK